MMRAKADPKATSTPILALACVLLAGALVGILWENPDRTLPARKERTQATKIQKDLAKAKRDTAAANAIVAAFTWTGEPATIQNEALTIVSSLAKKHGVTLVRFQPQRNTASSPILEQIPFLLVVEGTFPAVTALERELEQPANRLAVNLFQVGSSDSQTNAVSANIGVVAHRVPPVVEEKESNAVKRA